MPANIPRLIYFESLMNPIAGSMLGGRDDLDLVRLEYAAPVDENLTEMRRAHGYQIQPRTELREPWFGDAALLAECPNILAISSTGAGYDMIDVHDCTKGGDADRSQPRPAEMLGIIGIGNIGTSVAELCRGLFQMTVLAYYPYLTAEQTSARGATKVELSDLLRRSDYITVHCPRTKETFGLFGAAQFAMMKPTAYFINTARGGIHDEPALADAVKSGQISGAGLDVFLQEPPDLDHPLLHIDNVIVTPHNAGMTTESMLEMVAATAQQWIDVFHGKVPPRMVNPEA